MTSLIRRIGPPHVLVTLMAIVAGTSVYGALNGPLLVPLALLGALLGLIVTVVAERFRLLFAEWLAASIAAVIVVGGPAAGDVPTPAAYTTFFNGLTDGWANLLSSVPPVALAGEYRVLPFVLAWLASVVGFAFLRVIRIPGVAAVGPLAAFGLGLLFSVENRGVAVVQGGILAALALGLGRYQQRDLGLELDETIGNTTMARKRARLLGAGAILVAVAGLSPVIAPLVPGMGDRERFDLRDRLEPPWDPLNEPSPLAQIKANYTDQVRDDVVFIARGESIPRRWALAVLADYDGTVWTVGDSELSGSAPFVPIEETAPADPTPSSTPSTAVSVEVEVVDLDGPWLPTPGRLTAIEFAGVDGDGAVSLRFNQRTGTTAAPVGAQGLVYTVEATPWSSLPDEPDDVVSMVALTVEGLEGQAGVIRSRSADLIEGVEQGWPQVIAIRDELTGAGFYLADERARPGHSWARLSQFFGEEEWFGNEEQYAAVAGIVSRNAGMQTRVVVGFLLADGAPTQGEAEIRRTDATAWIEVLTVEHGWVPVDVTPPRDKVPTLSDPGVRTEPVAAPNPPPPPPPPPPTEADQAEPEEEEEEEEELLDDDAGIPVFALVAATAVGGPLGLMSSWIGIVAGAKVWRRRRRRSLNDPSQRVAGAWFEANDRVLESGVSANLDLSVIEHARHVESRIPEAAGLLQLAHVVDRAAFDRTRASDIDADAAWQVSGAVRESLRNAAPFHRRLLRLANPIPLLRKDPF